jgi:amino acid adenylation domain-containing protein
MAAKGVMQDPTPSSAGQRLLVTLRKHLRRSGEPALIRGDSPLFAHAPDSLELTRLALELSEGLGVEVPLRLLFDSRTVDELTSGIARLGPRPENPAHAGPTVGQGRRRQQRLSFSQERMAFMQALSTGSAAYHVAFGLRLTGTIDMGALARAIESLPRRFEVLRTRFIPSADGIVPLPLARSALTLRVITPSGEAAQGPDADLRIATEFCNAPFDLEAGDTAKAALICIKPDSSLLVLCFHHIVMDQWSYELLLEHLSSAYANELLGTPLTAPAVEPRFPEYAVWHRNWFRNNAFHRERAYWLRNLEGAARVSFEPDRPRGALASYTGARWRLAVPERTWQQLEYLALRERATLPMLLHAALALQLRNESGRDDVVIGAPVANRNHAASLNCFGALVNTLPLRVKVDGAHSFMGFLANVRETFLGAFEHQDMPFEVLIGQMRIERDPSVSPLFGVMLNVLNTPPARLALPNVSVERIEIDRCGAQFDLTLTVDRLHTKSIWFEYATDLYLESTIERIALRYLNLLDAILEDPGRDLDRLPQRTRAEATQIRHWSTGHGALAAATSCHDLLFAGARGRSALPAVVCSDATLTYGELHARAGVLAEALLAARVAGSGRVGLRLGRGSELPVALLAALKAGIAFVPLDSALPDERLAFIVKDAGIEVILTDSGDAGREDWMPDNVRLLPVRQALSGPVPCEGPSDGPAQQDPRREAYVLYTSGTTGQPKGVSIPDHALANFLHTMQLRPGMKATDRLLAVTTLSFDISLLELLLPLSVGACVVIASREQARDGDALAALVEQHDITVLQATPSTWIQLLESGWHGRESLRALVGGEPLPRELAVALLPRTSELWNMYGPTESTVWSTCARISSEQSGISIGRPVGGTSVEIVDRQDRPAGIGVHGEILIGGAGLALGYVNRPDLTAARFVTLAVDGNTSRHYRTGDLGAWATNGDLRVLGRLDRQIKVRGHRIEPEDIESCALRIPGVGRALVSVSQGTADDRRLVLHLVSVDGRVLDINAVRARLRTFLPEYMVPQVIAQVEAIPTLPNGKVDHRRLAQLLPIGSDAGAAGAAPLSHGETVLHGIWSELLGLPHIDRNHDFFELGGHSLLAMRLVTRVREELQKNCTLAQVFRHPTIASLCAALNDSAVLTAHTLVPLQEDTEGTALFCLCGIQLYRPLIHQLALEGPVLAAYVPASEYRSVEELSGEYLQIIRTHQPHGPYRLLGFSLGGVLAYELAQQLAAAGESVEQLVILDSDVPGEATPQAMLQMLRGMRRVLSGREAEPDSPPDYIRAIRDYRPQPYAGTAIYVEATRGDHFDPGYGWRDLVAGLTSLRLESDHLEMMSGQRAVELARLLRPFLVPSRSGSSLA